MDLKSIYDQSNMMGYDSLTDEQKQFLRNNASDNAKVASQLVQDNGIGAIQKIGNREVYGSLAKAVRKLMTKDNRIKASNIVGITKVRYPGETLTLMELKDIDLAGKDLATYMFENRARGVTQLTKKNDGVGWYSVRPDMEPYKYGFVRDHEIGHHFNTRSNHTMDGKYTKPKADEYQADAFAWFRGGERPTVQYPELIDQYDTFYNMFNDTKVKNYRGR